MPPNKVYLLDTSVLIYDPESLFYFAQHSVGIPFLVLEELDILKTENTERGAAARHVIKYLDSFRSKGSLKEGIAFDQGGALKVYFLPSHADHLIPLDEDIADNKILQTALMLQQDGHDVQFISKDINARVKADALGIPVHDYVNERSDQDVVYKGWIQVEVPSIQLKKDCPDILKDLYAAGGLLANQFVLVVSNNNPCNFRLFRLKGNSFTEVQPPCFKWPLEARNPQQLMALDLLLDPDVALVSLIGPAGTGKTFLALLAALHQTLVHDLYRKILISRPVIPLGPDIGYLPGSIEEKLHSWMQPMYDNMEFIAHQANAVAYNNPAGHQTPLYTGNRHKERNKHKKKHTESDSRFLMPLDQLTREGRISLEAITYMRGRSIPYQYILLDEVQNLTCHEVKTLISRVGQASKIVLLGDPYQIDAHYLGFKNNGLMYASDKFRGQSIFGTVFLENSERSELSRLATELL